MALAGRSAGSRHPAVATCASDGDAELAQRFQQLGKLLRPDAEEELAALFGDSVAHQMARDS